MKNAIILFTIATSALSSDAAYKETMDPDGLAKDLKADYGLVDDNAVNDQSEKFQQAIDELSAKGGGNLTIPKGTCLFNGVQLKSNVHVLLASPWSNAAAAKNPNIALFFVDDFG